MEEKKITSLEGMAIINEMIQRSKTRRFIGDGNILLMWGYLVVGVAALVWILIDLTHNPAMNWFWYLIWIIGGIATPIMARKRREKAGVTTYADKIGNAVWTTVGLSAIALTLICLGFFLFTGTDTWSSMLMLPLLIVGFAEIVQGVAIREKSLIWGGGIGIVSGLVTLCCIAGGIALYAGWFMPMFIMSFALMMILPGHILNYKSRKER